MDSLVFPDTKKHKSNKSYVFSGKEFDNLSNKVMNNQPIDIQLFKKNKRSNICYSIPYQEIKKLSNSIDKMNPKNLISELKKFKKMVTVNH